MDDDDKNPTDELDQQARAFGTEPTYFDDKRVITMCINGEHVELTIIAKTLSQ